MLRYMPLAALFLSQPILAAGSNGGEDTPSRGIETIVVASNACLISDTERPESASDFLAPVLSFVLPLAVEFFFDTVGEELTRVRKETSAGSAEFHLWSRTSGNQQDLRYNMPKCVTVLTGEFKKTPPVDERYLANPKLTEATEVADTPNVEALRERLELNGIEFESLNFVFEAKVEASEDKTSFSYRPQLFAAYDLLPGSRARRQGLVVNLALQGPGLSPWGTVYSNAAISFGEVGEGTVLYRNSNGRRALEKLDTGLMIFPGISGDARAALSRDGSLLEVMPSRLRAEWTQTKRPTDAARVLAFLLSKAKPKASSWVGGQFDADADFTSQQADQALEIAYLDAKVKWDTAVASDSSFDARVLAWTRLNRATAAYCRTQEKPEECSAEREQPRPNSEPVSAQ